MPSLLEDRRHLTELLHLRYKFKRSWKEPSDSGVDHSIITETLASLDYFRNNFVVLSSSVDEHENLYTNFLKLGIVDLKIISKSYCETKKFLSSVNSMNRFLKSLKILARKSA